MPLKKNYLPIKRSNVSKVHDTFYILYLSQNFNQEFTAQISVSQRSRLLSAPPSEPVTTTTQATPEKTRHLRSSKSHPEGKPLCLLNPDTLIVQKCQRHSLKVSHYSRNQKTVCVSIKLNFLPPAPGRPRQVKCTPLFQFSVGTTGTAQMLQQFKNQFPKLNFVPALLPTFQLAPFSVLLTPVCTETFLY